MLKTLNLAVAKRLYAFLLPLFIFSSLPAADISGELKTWHNVTLTFEGPPSAEDAVPNPFTDYRLTVTFTNGAETFTVPGYYAADGNAAHTSAKAGNKWRVHFVPNTTGNWTWRASFRHGKNIALSLNPRAGEPATFDGTSGSFIIQSTDKTGCDFRGKGLLEYTPTGYLQFAGTKEFFIKTGADSPENFLGYVDFDDTWDTGARTNDHGEATNAFLHKYEPHARDWRPGDPTWKNDKGKTIIGALNYLASEGMNSVYFLPFNIAGGDGKDTWPWTSPDERFRFDCSKLGQWEIVFSHMDTLGLMLHVVTQEQENDQALDSGELGPERKLYYRELIARFGHHLAITWNLGEENTNTTAQQKAFAKYIHDLDPWDHVVTVHTFPNKQNEIYPPLLGCEYLQGPSVQTNQTHKMVTKWIDASAKAGYRWYVSLDEIGPAHTGVKPDTDDPTHDEPRKKHLYGALMAGAGGVEWYFGYRFDHNDVNCEDWRSRDLWWDQNRYAAEFFHNYLPFTEMVHADELIDAEGGYCFALPGRVYAIYLPDGGAAALDLQNHAGAYTIHWYNPRTGGPLTEGSVRTIMGAGKQTIGRPPRDENKDWLALVRHSSFKLSDPRPSKFQTSHSEQSISGTDRIHEEKNGKVVIEAEDFWKQENTGKRQWVVITPDREPGLKPDPDGNHADSASGNAYLEILPDTRRNHGDKLIRGENFSNEPGVMGIISYRVHFSTPGRYYVWVRAFSTGSEDNGIHVGIDGTWPASGQRLQWCEGKNNWRWESKQRTQKVHCGEPYKIYLDVSEPGLHIISFSMREDGFEMDQWMMTIDRDLPHPGTKAL